MGSSKKYNEISDWNDVISDFQQSFQSIAIGTFDCKGNILEANKAMRYFLNTDENGHNPQNVFINPQFLTFTNNKTHKLIYDGLMTIGNMVDTSYVLQSKVFRKSDTIFIIAEADVPHLFCTNNQMSQLNQQVNNLHRQLIKEKLHLQNTLTELKETQQMLIHSEKMNALGKLVAGVAHEINNPLSYVYSNITSVAKYTSEVFNSINEIEELVALNGEVSLIDSISKIRTAYELDYLKDDFADLIKESKTGIERIKTIVENLRRFSRLDEAEIKQIDLMENIRATVSIVQAEINSKRIIFELKCPEDLNISCYPGQLNQALLNILLNAVQAVEIGGTIKLSVISEDHKTIIRITDNGCGIPPEIKDRIFDPFFTTKPVGSGTGLGLSITYKIIHDLHKGSIELDSLPGKGSNFTITLPKNV